MRDLIRRFCAMQPRTRRSVLLCAGAVLACLLLPLAVFAVWDRVLLGNPLPRADAGQADPLPDAGRQNQTACLLYDAALLQMTDTAQWPERQPAAAETCALRGQCAAAVERAEELGLVTPADAGRLRAALESDGFTLAVRSGPAGMTACTLTLSEPSAGTPQEEAPGDWTDSPAATPETAGEVAAVPSTPAPASPADDLMLELTLAPDGQPVAFCWQDLTRTDYFAETDGLLQPAMELLGVSDFTDWQPVDWGGRLPHAGEAAYSPTAQLYLTVNANGGLTVSAASMTPEQFATLPGGTL